MKQFFFYLLMLVQNLVASQAAIETYLLDSASIEHPGLPKGEVLKFVYSHSDIFRGTQREYRIYAPVQYKPGKPACVYLNQEGMQWQALTVFVNLIYKNEIPATIGVFISLGEVVADSCANALNRVNRNFEYDGYGDTYARFILSEILPDVEKQKSSDGRPIYLLKNGSNRAIWGESSGAICAFTVAWEHPEEFSKVFSAIVSYIGLQGGDCYPTLIRK